MMKTKAFTLTELLVGLLISMFLAGAMATFVGDVGYTFQENKSMSRDRGQLQQALDSLTRDLMFVGANADEFGVFFNEGNATWFLDMGNDGDPNLGTRLSYYRLREDIDHVASAEENKEYSYYTITYDVDTNGRDPITGDPVNILTRNGQPFLIGVSQFSLEFGVDSDGDGIVSAEEWTREMPTDAATKNATIGSMRSLRVTLARTTTTIDEDRTEEHVLKREIMLRNRS